MIDQQADHPLGAHPVGKQDAEGELVEGTLQTKESEEIEEKGGNSPLETCNPTSPRSDTLVRATLRVSRLGT